MRSKVPQLREDIPLLTPYCENCLKRHPTRYCPSLNQSHSSEPSLQQSSVIVKQCMDFSRVSDIKTPELTPHQQPYLTNELYTKQSSHSCHTSNYRPYRFPSSQLNVGMRDHFRNRFSASIPYIGAFRACWTLPLLVVVSTVAKLTLQLKWSDSSLWFRKSPF